MIYLRLVHKMMQDLALHCVSNDTRRKATKRENIDSNPIPAFLSVAFMRQIEKFAQTRYFATHVDATRGLCVVM